MSDLVKWLRAQLDEDERTALGVADRSEPWAGQWRADGDTALRTHNGWVLVYGREGAPLAPGFVYHVARHDPARVLAEVEAKRRLLDEVFRYEATIDGNWGCCHDAVDIAAGLCPEIEPDEIPAVRLLALPYAGQPGWREEWRA